MKRGRTSPKPAAPSTWPMYGFVGAVAVACYLNGLSGDFVHDDIPAVTLNKDALGESPVMDLLKNDFWGTPMSDVTSHKSWRPLTVLTFRANVLMFGLQPAWFHANNVALHAASCLLFTKVCLCVAALKAPFATLAGLLFAAHPIHTEAVTGIVGRADVLACIFFLISLLAYHGIDGKCYIWISVIIGGLSMLAKETGITVFVLNLAYDTYRTWPSIKKTIVEVRWSTETQQYLNRAAKILTSLGILLAIRLAILQGSLPRFSHQDNPAAFHPSLPVRILTFCYLAAFNWWLLVCPATLSHDWQMGSVPLVTSVLDSRNLLTCFFFGLLVLLVIKVFVDFEQNQRHIPLVLGVLLLVLPFLPATNLFVIVGFVVAERVLYIPSMGSILLVVYGVQLVWGSYPRHRQTIVCFLLLLLTTNCLRIVIRNRDWRSRESLLRAGLITLPHNAKMHYNFGNFLRDSERPELAKAHYETALRLWPSYASAHNNLGTLINNELHAERHFLMAIRFSADHINAHYNLGQLYRRTNRTLDSERMLQRCLELEPKFTPAYIELARLRGPQDNTVGDLLRRVVHLHPSDSRYHTIYGHWLSEKGNALKSIKYYWTALKNDPNHVESLMGVSRKLRKFGQRSRLFQLITRWHSIQRLKRGQFLMSPDIYLHGWHLKFELSSKAKAYDPCPLKTAPCQKMSHVQSTTTRQQRQQQHQSPHHEDANYSTTTVTTTTTATAGTTTTTTTTTTSIVHKWPVRPCNKSRSASGSVGQRALVAAARTSCRSRKAAGTAASIAQQQAHRTAPPIMVHHFLDTV